MSRKEIIYTTIVNQHPYQEAIEYKGVHCRYCGMTKGTSLAKVMINSEKI